MGFTFEETIELRRQEDVVVMLSQKQSGHLRPNA